MAYMNFHYTEYCTWVVNEIFQEEGIGYELIFPPQTTDRKPLWPEFIKKYGHFVHEEIIRPCLESLRRPCLESLRNPKLVTANLEMLNAHGDYRAGDYAGSIVKACASLESVLKTVLHEKGVTGFGKDALAKLSDKCLAANIYPSFANEIIKNTGSIRNKMGGHGGGPTPEFSATKEYADHMLQLVSSHISFVLKQAGL